MCPSSQKKGPKNIPAKTAMPVSNAAMTAAMYASTQNPAIVSDQRKIKGCYHESHKLLF